MRHGDDADKTDSIFCMRTVLNLDDALVAEAVRYAGLKNPRALVHEGLRALIQRGAGEGLIALGGKDRRALAGPRRKAR